MMGIFKRKKKQSDKIEHDGYFQSADDWAWEKFQERHRAFLDKHHDRLAKGCKYYDCSMRELFECIEYWDDDNNCWVGL